MNVVRSRRPVWRSLAFLTVLPLLATGCGSGSAPIAGEVTRNGNPVSSGMVRFTPDINQGNEGPSFSVKISDGRFSNEGETTQVTPGPNTLLVVVPGEGEGGEVPSEEHVFHVNIPDGGQQDMKLEVSSKTRRKN